MSDSIYTKHVPGGDDLYLKIKDGDKVKLRLFSEPAIVLFKEGQKPRYAWVVWSHDKNKAQVYGAGISVFSQIAGLVEDWGEPTEFDISITRKGSGQFDTEYFVNPVKNSISLTEAQQAEANKVDLLNATKGKWLAEYEKDGQLPEPVTTGVADEPATDEVAPMPTDEDAPIDLDSIPF